MTSPVRSDERREYDRAYYERNKERIKARTRTWALENPDKVAEYRRRWQANNKERFAEHRRRWEEKNPEAHREYLRSKKARRRALKKNADGHTTATDRLMRWEFYGGRCAYCGNPANEMDHVIALARGGSNWPANLRPACYQCNRRKRDKPLAEFLSEKEMMYV